MAQQESYENVFQRYHESETRFQHFVLGITLAILAFSVQYTKTPALGWTSWVIVASWACLLVSFIFGLWRLETLVVIRKMDVERVNYPGDVPPIEWESRSDKLRSRVMWVYHFQKYGLLAGLCFYAIFYAVNFLIQP